MIKIAIEIDEILRAKWLAFDRYYADKFGDEHEALYTLNFFKDYIWKDTEEKVKYLNESLPENVSPLEYIIDEKTGKAPVDDFAFIEKIEKRTAEENYDMFMEEYVMEIYGFATKMYKNLEIDLKNFVMKFKDYLDITIISKENTNTIPSTLFFLSKLMCRFRNYKFYSDYSDVWNEYDIIITTNPELINTVLEDKTVIKLNRPYNINIESEYEYIHILDLIDDENFMELINYKENKNKE